MKRVLILLGAICLFPSVYCEETFVYRAKSIQLTPTQLISAGEILVRGSKIIEVGPTVSRPKGSKVIDWGSFQVYPGLISPGSSLGLAEINALRPTRDEREVGSHTAEIEAWSAINPDSELIPVARANGITHSWVVPMGGTISGISGLIRLEGWGIEEMTVRKSVALHLWWPGQGLATKFKTQSVADKKPKALKEQDKERKRSLVELDEFFNRGEAYAKARQTKDLKVGKNPTWEAMLPFLNAEMPIVIHAEDARQITSALDWAKKRQYEIILSGAKDSWKLAERLAEEEVPVIFRHIFTAPPQSHQPHDLHFRAPGILAEAGVRVSIGLRLGAWAAANQRNLPYYAAQANAYGLSRADAIASITRNPARLLGMQDRLGTLEKGKDATFIACDGDLLDLRTQVVDMRIEGKRVSLASRHTRLRERYLNRPNPYRKQD